MSLLKINSFEANLGGDFMSFSEKSMAGMEKFWIFFWILRLWSSIWGCVS